MVEQNVGIVGKDSSVIVGELPSRYLSLIILFNYVIPFYLGLSIVSLQMQYFMISVAETGKGSEMRLRLLPSKNNQEKNVKWAANYEI